jgi:hypothetical protein
MESLRSNDSLKARQTLPEARNFNDNLYNNFNAKLKCYLTLSGPAL